MKEIYEKGLVEYKKAVKRNPQDANAYFNMSKAYDGLNEGRKAMLAARKAQQIWELKNDAENSAKARKRLRELNKNYPSAGHGSS
jgi:tetratricopeptide (TPR) repeat protein